VEVAVTVRLEAAVSISETEKARLVEAEFSFSVLLEMVVPKAGG